MALAHRLWNGDHMILDEWNIGQFYAPILLPFYAIYRLLVPEGNGVYLYARVVYVLFSTIVSVLFYQRCCKNAKNRVLPLIAALLPLLYSRANICGPSYYNLCFQFVIASLLLLWKNGDHDPLHQPMMTGMFLALAVLCNPVLSIYVFCGLIILYVSRKTRKVFYNVLTGVALTALIYIIYLIHFGRPLELINGIPQLLKNPASSGNFISKIYQNGKTLTRYVSIYVFPVVVMGSVASIWFWKRGGQIRGIIKTTYLLLCLLLIGYTACRSKISICFVITVPFTILIFPFAIRTLLSRSNGFALMVYGTGIALAIAFFIASNTGADAMTTGTCLSSAGGVLLLFNNGKSENYEDGEKRIHSFEQVICICICLVLVGVFSAHRFLGIYRDAPVLQLTQRIEIGPAAGLYTTDEHAKEYNSIMNEIIKIHEDYPSAGVLYSKTLPWAYLASNWRCADFTVWATKLSDPRIEEYYQTHQEPDIVFVFVESVAGFETAPFNNHKKTMTYNQNELDGPFYDFLMENYQVIDTNELLTVYCKAEF